MSGMSTFIMELGTPRASESPSLAPASVKLADMHASEFRFGKFGATRVERCVAIGVPLPMMREPLLKILPSPSTRNFVTALLVPIRIGPPLGLLNRPPAPETLELVPKTPYFPLPQSPINPVPATPHPLAAGL